MSGMTGFVKEYFESCQSTSHGLGVSTGGKIRQRRLKAAIGFEPCDTGPMTKSIVVFVLAFQQIQIHNGPLVGNSHGRIGLYISLDGFSKGKIRFQFGGGCSLFCKKEIIIKIMQRGSI